MKGVKSTTLAFTMSVMLTATTGFAQSTQSLTFTAIQGQVSAAQSVPITMTPNCPSCTILVNQVPRWLTITPFSPMGSTTISIIANANSLTAGSYSASVSLNMGGNPNITVSPSTLNVTFVVTASNLPVCSKPSLTIVGAGDFSSPVAPGSIVSLFGANITSGVYTASDQSPTVLPTTLGGVSATITDVLGNTLPVSLIAVTPGQVNAVLPSGSQSGPIIVNLTASSGAKSCGSTTLAPVAPSLFTADQTGNWLAAAQVVIAHPDGSQTVMNAIAQYSSTLVFNGSRWSNWTPIPINLGSSTDVAVLELFGTGIRGVNAFASAAKSLGTSLVSVDVCSKVQNCTPYGSLNVLYAGAQGNGGSGSFYGLDQINVVLPHSLSGSGVMFVEVGVVAPCSGCGLVPWMVDTLNVVQIDIQ